MLREGSNNYLTEHDPIICSKFSTLPKFNLGIYSPERKRTLHVLENATVIKGNRFFAEKEGHITTTQ